MLLEAELTESNKDGIFGYYSAVGDDAIISSDSVGVSKLERALFYEGFDFLNRLFNTYTSLAEYSKFYNYIFVGFM